MRSAFCVRILHLVVHFFVSLIMIIHVCLADWGSASDTLSDALSFSPYNIAFDCTFLCFVKIAFVCLADWGSASDTLSDTLCFSPLNIAFGCPFISFTKITFVC